MPMFTATINLPDSVCTCGQVLNAASGKGTTTPKPGSFTVCSECAAVYVFREDMKLEPVDVDSLQDEDLVRQLHELQDRIRRFRCRGSN